MLSINYLRDLIHQVFPVAPLSILIIVHL